MKYLATLIFGFFFLVNNIFSANLEGGDKIKIVQVEAGDYYIGGSEIDILTPILGDLIISGGEINIHDSIYGDVLSAGGTTVIDGVVMDDIRISGGEIEINSLVKGDLIAFGGRIKLDKGAMILGDVICFGGEIILEGEVKGNLMAYAGDIRLKNKIGGNASIHSGSLDFQGSVGGDMEIGSEEIELGDGASCEGSIRYWTSAGELDFTGVCDNVTFDEELAFEDKDMDHSLISSLLGVGFFIYWVIFILASLLVLIIIEYFFGRHFDMVAQRVKESFVKSFGYGMLYLLGLPVLIIFSFIIIIGIPIGLLGISLYSMSLLFSTAIVGLCLAHYYRNKSGQTWSSFQMIAYSLLTVIILKIIFMLPFLGQLLKTIAMAAVYGAFLLIVIEGKKKKIS